MVFSSLPFLFVFLPVVLLACYVLPGKCRNYVLLLANLLFFAYGEPVYILLMIASIIGNYAFGLLLERCEEEGIRKRVLILDVVLNLLSLAVFKYAGLLTGTLHRILPFVPEVSLNLPIGISFYTFQAMSYVIDVYRAECVAEHNLVDFAGYISLFPQLIAGPIVRYTDIRDQLRDCRQANIHATAGARLFAVGLAKKVLLANSFGLLWEEASANPMGVGTLGVWLGVAAYALQLYFDFSGYSDMARGLGALLGFDFCTNFRYPYISKSITEFWHRWHISLSTWFRDYVYFPLGGSRRGTKRMCGNLLLTWALTGLWHGAGYNFLFWGIYYGVLLIGEKLLWGKAVEKWPAIFRHVYTLLIVLIGWVFFASESFDAAWEYLRAMFSFTGGTVTGGILSWVPLLTLGCVAATPLGAQLWQRVQHRPRAALLSAALCLTAMILSTACLVSESYNPFLYFRF